MIIGRSITNHNAGQKKSISRTLSIVGIYCRIRITFRNQLDYIPILRSTTVTTILIRVIHRAMWWIQGVRKSITRIETQRKIKNKRPKLPQISPVGIPFPIKTMFRNPIIRNPTLFPVAAVVVATDILQIIKGLGLEGQILFLKIIPLNLFHLSNQETLKFQRRILRCLLSRFPRLGREMQGMINQTVILRQSSESEQGREKAIFRTS